MANYSSGGLDTLWWSPEEYAELAQDLTKYGKNYEEYINEALEAINNLGTSGAWTGYLYNQLIEQINTERVTLDDDATLLTETIPTAISNQAQEQASANHGSIAPINVAALEGIINPQSTDDDGTVKVYLDPTTVNSAFDAFCQNMKQAETTVQKYSDLFNATVARGFNVSRDIKVMGSSIESAVEHVVSFLDKFGNAIPQAATDSAHVMAAAQDQSSSEAEKIQ